VNTRGTRALVVAIGALAVAGSVLGLSAPAQAHNYLVKSTPSANEVLTTLPDRFSIITNDVLLDLTGKGDGFALQVRDAAGRYYGDGCVKVDGPGMSTGAALGAGGTYRVVWQIVSADGHNVSDSFSFTWKPPAGAVPSAGSKSAPDCHGTQSVGSASSAPPAAQTGAAGTGDTLGTVLWIGGAVIAVGAAVVVTLLLTSRRKPE
jgi:methionine-rich copper-binding protein CopC